MESHQHIRAFHQREERYQGLELNYQGHPELQNEILNVFESVKEETGLNPTIYNNNITNDKDSIYIEFHDDYDRDGGHFFTAVLSKLGIDRCEV